MPSTMHERGHVAERLGELQRRHWGEIGRHIARLGVAPGDVEDVAQEAFVVAASKLASEPSGTDRAFLHAVAARVACNARRASLRRRRAYERYFDVAPEPAPTPEELSERLRGRALIDDVLRGMTPELRTVFVLCELEEISVPEIARRLDVPVGTAASRLRRAREAFSRASRDARGALTG
jgi:RNA polymerase sigma-70 factor (ECF subfamily)